jgi:hypothetical protein
MANLQLMRNYPNAGVTQASLDASRDESRG